LIASDEPDRIREWTLEAIAKKVGASKDGLRANPSALNDADSFDVVELVMELESRFDEPDRGGGSK
jgi:acyl carrier protein